MIYNYLLKKNEDGPVLKYSDKLVSGNTQFWERKINSVNPFLLKSCKQSVLNCVTVYTLCIGCPERTSSKVTNFLIKPHRNL